MKKTQRWKQKIKKLIVGRAKDNKRHKIFGRRAL